MTDVLSRMPEMERDPFYIEPVLIRRVAISIRITSDPLDQILAGYLDSIIEGPTTQNAVTLLGRAAVNANFVRVMTTDSDFEQRSQGGAPAGPVVWASQFVKLILDDLRETICGNKKKPTPLGSNNRAILSVLAKTLTHKLQIAEGTATVFAVLAFLAVGQTTKSAFCKMTDEEVLEALRNST